ncbi:uncharacterized protein LOC109810720 [Cajanus cajan]|uniref:uncharacterized protein LOC109810720 n=1 Tax=Cajanus cajan TaxID=3821 RepID=UPI00098D8921|nr:uncharacterized protein LOC109810720 [Cajanus cajan]
MPPANFFSQKRRTTTRISSRHRPILHTCGVSMLAIVDIAIGKTQNINGPLGSTLRRATKLAKFATPFIYTMQFQWLTMLSFIDDAILATEKITEKLFPPSTRLFDKVDEILLMVVSLPEKFDGAVNKFPTIIHEVPFLDRTLTLVISRLNMLVSLLKHWGHDSRANEKTIGVDNESACEGYLSMDDNIANENVESFPPISEVECKGSQDIAVNSTSHMKGSYKEALERGKDETPLEKMEKESEKKIMEGDDCECERGKKNDGNNEQCDVAVMKNQVGASEGIKDALLELFESAWLMKAGQY